MTECGKQEHQEKQDNQENQGNQDNQEQQSPGPDDIGQADRHLQERYSRQTLFAPIGEEGQRKLLASSVLIVGMGALGTVLANHMVRAGVGHIRFVDRDFVEASNLQRQMLFAEEDALQSLPKAVAAERKLKEINSGIAIEGHVGDVTAANIGMYAEGVDLILDGTDNFRTRFVMNDYAFQAGIPFIYGGAVSSRGMQATFIPGKTPCLRCFIAEGSGSGETCDTVGVLASIIDIVASYQATEAI
jgi:molybdopterin-synthase adenylyltransferase